MLLSLCRKVCKAPGTLPGWRARSTKQRRRGYSSVKRRQSPFWRARWTIETVSTLCRSLHYRGRKEREDGCDGWTDHHYTFFGWPDSIGFPLIFLLGGGGDVIILIALSYIDPITRGLSLGGFIEPGSTGLFNGKWGRPSSQIVCFLVAIGFLSFVCCMVLFVFVSCCPSKESSRWACRVSTNTKTDVSINAKNSKWSGPSPAPSTRSLSCATIQSSSQVTVNVF